MEEARAAVNNLSIATTFFALQGPAEFKVDTEIKENGNCYL